MELFEDAFLNEYGQLKDEFDLVGSAVCLATSLHECRGGSTARALVIVLTLLALLLLLCHVTLNHFVQFLKLILAHG